MPTMADMTALEATAAMEVLQAQTATMQEQLRRTQTLCTDGGLHPISTTFSRVALADADGLLPCIEVPSSREALDLASALGVTLEMTIFTCLKALQILASSGCRRSLSYRKWLFHCEQFLGDRGLHDYPQQQSPTLDDTFLNQFDPDHLSIHLEAIHGTEHLVGSCCRVKRHL